MSKKAHEYIKSRQSLIRRLARIAKPRDFVVESSRNTGSPRPDANRKIVNRWKELYLNMFREGFVPLGDFIGQIEDTSVLPIRWGPNNPKGPLGADGTEQAPWIPAWAFVLCFGEFGSDRETLAQEVAEAQRDPVRQIVLCGHGLLSRFQFEPNHRMAFIVCIERAKALRKQGKERA